MKKSPSIKISALVKTLLDQPGIAEKAELVPEGTLDFLKQIAALDDCVIFSPKHLFAQKKAQNKELKKFLACPLNKRDEVLGQVDGVYDAMETISCIVCGLPGHS